jgi:hypothetical protein
VAAEASNFLMGRTFLDIDMARAADLLGMDRRQADMFRDLPRGAFVSLGPALSRRPLPVTIGPVETSARSTSPKLMPLPDQRLDAENLILTPDPEEFSKPVARRTAAPPRPTTDILAELSKSALMPDAASETRAPAADMTADARDHLIDKVLKEILAPAGSAFHSDAVLYQDFLVRARMRRLPGPPLALKEFRHRVAIVRSGVDPDIASSEGWTQALALSSTVSDDLQGVFLLLAKAALGGEICPSDSILARAYGTHSERRARRLLSYFEEQGLIVVHTDFAGLRSIAFPDLDCQTLPGDPNAADEPQSTLGAAAE